MVTKVASGAIRGLDPFLVEIEVDIRSGLPGCEIVGLVGTALRESRERVRSALTNSGFSFPLRRVTVNMAPAGIRKDGAIYDLPIALGILAAQGLCDNARLLKHVIVGELSLNGDIRPVTGALLYAELAAVHQRPLLVPADNGEEAAAITDCQVLGVSHLCEVVAFLQKKTSIKVMPKTPYKPHRPTPNFNGIHGQQTAKRALTIAASGHHHVLLVGPPGCGKTMLAKSLSGLLPPLAQEEALEVTKIRSTSKLLPNRNALLPHRPTRSPHHSISLVGLTGGGNPIRPGEITLAHRGVLILDELLEFSNEALQALREPLETAQLTIIRSNERVVFPANFLLAATANPCPCGYLGDLTRECRCSTSQVRRYQKKLSGPLLDRIDLFVFLQPLNEQELTADTTDTCLLSSNALPRHGLRPPTAEAQAFLRKAHSRLALSVRGYHKTLEVAKTIAWMDGKPEIRSEHIAEALQYRFEALRLF